MSQRRLNIYVKERSHTLVRAGDLMVEPALCTGSSVGSELRKAFETIYLARPHVFKLKFGVKFLISSLQSLASLYLAVCWWDHGTQRQNRNWDSGSLYQRT
jgi:hypothetical protein